MPQPVLTYAGFRICLLQIMVRITQGGNGGGEEMANIDIKSLELVQSGCLTKRLGALNK